jgi:hypothetical protein
MMVSRVTFIGEGLQDLLGDRRGDRAALALLALEHDGDGDSAVKPMNHRSLMPLDVDLRGAGLAGHLDALERGRGAGALAHDASSSPSASRRLGGHHALGLLGQRLVDVRPSGSTTFATSRGSIRTPPLPIVCATVAICSGVTQQLPGRSPCGRRRRGEARQHRRCGLRRRWAHLVVG